MNIDYPSEKINKNIAFYKKAVERISASGAHIQWARIASAADISNDETIEQGLVSISITSEQYEAVQKELDAIAADYKNLDERAVAKPEYRQFNPNKKEHNFSLILRLGKETENQMV